MTAATDQFTPLGEVKRFDCLALFRDAMARVGTSTQTLAAVRTLAFRDGETFAAVRVIAHKACLPQRTVERHLDHLVSMAWLETRGRESRRTVTYRIPGDLLNNNDDNKFGLLPRWAAKILPNWSTRAVFSLLVARDSLIENALDDTPVPDEEAYGRSMYSVAALSRDSGLSLRAVHAAKDTLIQMELVHRDSSPVTFWRDEFGRCRSFADNLLLNHDYPVPEHLIDRPAKVAVVSVAKVVNRTANLAVIHCNSDGDPPQIWREGSAEMAVTPCKSGGCSDSQLLPQVLDQFRLQPLLPTSAVADGLRVEVEKLEPIQEIQEKNREWRARIADDPDGVPW